MLISAHLSPPASLLWIIQRYRADILEDPLICRSPGLKTPHLWASTCTQRTACLIGYLSPWHRNVFVDETAVKLILSKLTLCSQGPPSLQNKGEMWAVAEEITPSEVAFSSEITKHVSSDFPSRVHWCVHLFIGSAQRPLQHPTPHKGPCHICIFLIAQSGPDTARQRRCNTSSNISLPP